MARRAVSVVHRYDRKRISGPISRIRRNGDVDSAYRYVTRQMESLNRFRERAIKAEQFYKQRETEKSQRPVDQSKAASQAAARQFMNTGAIPPQGTTFSTPSGGVKRPADTGSMYNPSTAASSAGRMMREELLSASGDGNSETSNALFNPAMIAAAGGGPVNMTN